MRFGYILVVTTSSFLGVSALANPGWSKLLVTQKNAAQTHLSKPSPSTAKSKVYAHAKSKSTISEKDAENIVAKRPDVKEWKRGVINAAAQRPGLSAHIEFDRKEGNDLVIHVYEQVPDDAGTSHSATFNWYHVNAKSGKVTKEF